MTANQSSSASEVLVASQPNETQKVIVEVEPLVVNSDPIVEVTTAPTQKTALDTDVVTVYSLAATSSENNATATAPVTSTVEKKSASTAPPQQNTTKAAVVHTAAVAPKNTVPPKTSSAEKSAKVVAPQTVAKAPAPVAKPIEKPILIAKATQVVQTESMTIEQVDLTPQDLAKQAISRARKAVESNDANTAISEYTKALRFVPTDEATRQRLAALYYGKRQTRKAMDLLQQGIQINQDGEPLRIALAKLLLKEKQTEAALSPLAYLPNNASNDYLALRAGVAQQIKNVDIAKQSYSMLAEREPQNGRWWLGLAIQQERSLEFELAMASYQSALGKVGVSNSSQDFIRQRIALLTSMQESSDGN
jgi:MSHA biogenesis protein MshN